MRKPLAMAALLLALVATSSAQARINPSTGKNVQSLRASIRWNRSMTWHYQDIAGVTRTYSEHVERRVTSVPFLRWDRHMWSHRRVIARRLAHHRHLSVWPPHHALWECLHSVEAGSWHDHDSGGSGHYGGLQMGPDWLREFSGTADRYSEVQQEWFAERAFRSSGYSSSFIYGQWLEWEHGAGDKCIPLE